MFSMALFYIYLHMTFSRFIDKSVKGQGVPQRCILSTICPLISLIFQENIKICTYSSNLCLLVCFPQSCTHQDLLSRNVLGLAMRMFPPQTQYHQSVMSTDGLTVVTHCCWPMALCAAGCILQAKLTSLDT